MTAAVVDLDRRRRDPYACCDDPATTGRCWHARAIARRLAAIARRRPR